MCGEWLVVEIDDGQMEKVIYVVNIGDMVNYKYLFLLNSVDGFYDEYFWILVVVKLLMSSFICVQWVLCCLLILFSIMIVNVMFYDNGKIDIFFVFYFGFIKISMC